MSGFCTYTVEAHEDDGTARDVPCARARVGEVTGPGIRVVLCRRHFDKVARAILKDPQGLTLTSDHEERP